MKGKVLIVEDTKELADLVSLYLTKEGLEIRAVESAELALDLLPSWTPDLVVLDINLPGMDGFEFLSFYRKTNSAPVLIVSARDADEDIIWGLGYGADEFVTKPFSPRVLVARVRAMLRRAGSEGGDRDNAAKTAFGPFLLDRDACVLKKGDERIQLSAKEYGVLAFLAVNLGKPQLPEEIYAAVWKNAFGDLTTVAVYIQRLRKKLEEDPASPRFLETVHGMGYRLNQTAAGEEHA
jgi:two-component system response regulator RegX3